MKRIFTLLATCWVLQKAMAAFIPAGTMLYLDASKAWTNETSITARFSSDGMSAQEVAMTRTAGEQHIWQVSAPTPGPWTVVTFQSISGYQTAELIWGGYQSLYVVTCDACGSGQKAAGEWRYFTPLPDVVVVLTLSLLAALPALIASFTTFFPAAMVAAAPEIFFFPVSINDQRPTINFFIAAASDLPSSPVSMWYRTVLPVFSIRC